MGAGLGGAILGGASGIAGGIIANKGNQKLAQQQQDWNRQNWQDQNDRDDKLWQQQNAYNEKMWHAQNAYNSPQEQMARFTEAGLNKHLIYGQGSSGTAGALSAAPRKQQAIAPYSRAQSQNVLKGMNVFGEYQNFKNLEARTDNIKAQTDGQIQQNVLLGQKELMQALSLKHGDFKFKQDQKLADYQVEAAAENLTQLRNNVAMQKAKSLGLSLDNKLKRQTGQQKAWGINDTDNVLLRMGGRAASSFETTDLYKQAKKGWLDLWK